MEVLYNPADWMMLICTVSTVLSLLMCVCSIRGDTRKAGAYTAEFDIRTGCHGLPQNRYRFALEQSRRKYRIQVISMPAVSSVPQGTQYRHGSLYLKGTYTDQQQAREAAESWAERVQAETAGDWNGCQ